MATLCDTENKVRDMIAAYKAGDDREQVVLNVFKALWHAALPLDRIEACANAMYNLEHQPGSLYDACETLKEKKMLRRRKEHGTAYYELNY